MLKQDDILRERYRIIDSLGEGTFATTYLAEDNHMPSRVTCVVKHLKKNFASQLLQKVFTGKIGEARPHTGTFCLF